MTEQRTDEPAFPTEVWDSEGVPQHTQGMTLRDYFAAKAMHGLLTHLAHGIRPQDCIVMAEDAYLLADAMLKAREQK